MKIAITGGGSGGHLSPALAVIQEIKELESKAQILYIGGRLGMEGTGQPSIEQEVVPQTNIPHVFICAGKLQRRWAVSTFFLLLGVIPGFFEALFHLLRFRPRVLFSTGGYVSVPVVFAAWLIRIPVIIHEQTATVGLANRLAALFAHQIYVGFPSSIKHFPAGKAAVSGNPLRTEILKAVSLRNQRNKLQQPPLVYITGGAQGSHKINAAVREIFPILLKKYQVILQCGDNRRYRDFMKMKKERDSLPDELGSRLRLVKYVGPDDIGHVFHQADVVVGRSGANTVNEIMALGLPAVLIPIPWVTNNEQYKNARILINAGSSVLLAEDKLNGEKLLEMLDRVFDGYDKFTKKAEAVQKQTRLDAGCFLAKKILRLGRIREDGKDKIAR